MKPIVLKGITWNHSRALPPLVATAQRFEELYPEVKIQWSKRTLHEFGHADLPTLAENFDLLVIDHPMCGDAEQSGAIYDLLPMLSREHVEDLREDSISLSFASYLYHDKLYALPIDAAAPAASYRADLLHRNGSEEPKRWEDVIALARSGLVRMPGFSADLFLNFLGLCATRNSETATSAQEIVDRETGAICLEQLSELVSLMPDEIYGMNPITLYEKMAREDSIAYCPFAYTYSNYSREGFAPACLHFANPVSLEVDLPIRTVLGGTGIAVSAQCREIPIAIEYCLFIASHTCQRSLYGMCGGQPARRSAWRDPLLNRVAGDFFLRTIASMETAWVRPRYPGYVGLQVNAGEVLARHCRSRGNTRQTIEEINRLYRASREEGVKHG